MPEQYYRLLPNDEQPQPSDIKAVTRLDAVFRPVSDVTDCLRECEMLLKRLASTMPDSSVTDVLDSYAAVFRRVGDERPTAEPMQDQERSGFEQTVKKLNSEKVEWKQRAEKAEANEEAMCEERDDAQNMSDLLASIILREAIDWPDHHGKWREAVERARTMQSEASRLPARARELRKAKDYAGQYHENSVTAATAKKEWRDKAVEFVKAKKAEADLAAALERERLQKNTISRLVKERDHADAELVLLRSQIGTAYGLLEGSSHPPEDFLDVVRAYKKEHDALRVNPVRQPPTEQADSWKQVMELIAANALHKKKHFRLQEATQEMALGHLQQELNELRTSPNDASEVADMFGILIHYCLMHGWSKHFMEQTIVDKLNERFTEQAGADDSARRPVSDEANSQCTPAPAAPFDGGAAQTD